jgi:hypothetical protein
MSITEELSNIIKKHLPEQPAEEMRKFINDYNLQKSDLETAKKALENANQKIKELKMINETLTDNLSEERQKVRDVFNREVAVAGREHSVQEREIEVRKKEIIIDMCEERVKDMKELTSLVFKSGYKRTVDDSIPIKTKYWSQGGYNPVTGQNEMREEESVGNYIRTTTETIE